MANARVRKQPTNINQVKQRDDVPLVHRRVLIDNRVMLVSNLDVETVLAGMKPFLYYSQVDAINAETNRGTKAGMLIDTVQRLSVKVFNAFWRIIAGTQPDLFKELIGRAPSEIETGFCVETFAESLRKCIKSKGYSTDSPLDEIIDLDSEHVQLTIVRDTVESEVLVTEEPAELSPSYLTRLVNIEDNVPAVDVLKSGNDEEKPKRVLISGRSGTGKSTTMQWLAREWSFNRWETDFTLVFFLQLRMLSLFDCPMTVIELLMLHSLYTVTEADLVCLVSSWLKTSGARVLIFIDGLDEVSGFTERHKKVSTFTDIARPIDLCLNIIHGNLLKMATVVSASRPFSGLTGTINFQRHFEIIGLSESQVIEFVKRKHPSKAVSITSVLYGSPLIMSICGITFYCAAISSLIADGVIFKTEELETYTRLISFLLVQHVSRKLTQWPFLIEVSPYFRRLASMAYRGIFGRQLDGKITQLVFNKYDIVQAELNSQDLNSLQSTGLLQIKTPKTDINRDTFAEFYHFSIQELLASAYLLSNFPNSKNDFKRLFSGGQFNMAQLYLFGLRCDSGSRWLKEVRFAVNPSGQSVHSSAVKYIDELLQELCEQCQDESHFTSKLRLCQLLHEGQLENRAKGVAKYIVSNGKLIIENTPLTIIDLMAVNFVCKHVHPICEIHLKRCSANSTLVEFVASSIMRDHETTLHTLNLSQNTIDCEGAASIARMLNEDYKLQTLNLQGNNIGENGATALATALQKNTTIKTLNIGGNNIGDHGATDIAVELENNKSIVTLDVAGNNIGENGATALATALKKNATLKTLNVGGNNIGDRGATDIAVELENNKSIVTLDVAGNNIGDNGAAAVYSALLNNTTLKTLNVGENIIGDDGAIGIAAALRKNSKLEVLNVSYNKIGDTGLSALFGVEGHGLRIISIPQN